MKGKQQEGEKEGNDESEIAASSQKSSESSACEAPNILREGDSDPPLPQSQSQARADREGGWFRWAAFRPA